jgi:hypothetical protein
MLKYLSKFASDILPSVAATIIGAYIVNHYISAKPAPDAPAAAVSLADPKSAGSKPAETPADVANIPAAGVRAKGISEKAIFDRSTAEKAQEKPQEKPQEKSPEKSAEKSAEKPEDKPAQTASIPADTRRHPSSPREKTAIRTIPLTSPAAVQPATSMVAPAPATPPAPTVEAALPPEERRDANDLARAAIERLRGGNENSLRAQEAARSLDATPRMIAAPQGQPPAILRPLPPPITVSTPPAETFGSAAGSSQTQQPYPTSARIDDPRRPTPPADIPSAQPSDLRAEAAEPPVREHRNVAEDMLSAAKSVFHSVLPQ